MALFLFINPMAQVHAQVATVELMVYADHSPLAHELSQCWTPDLIRYQKATAIELPGGGSLLGDWLN